MNRVAIVEIDAGGHRLEYVRNVLQIIGRPATLYTTRPVLRSAQFEMRLQGFVSSGQLTTVAVGETCRSFADRRRFWKQVFAHLSGRSSKIVVTNVDEHVLALLALGRTQNIIGLIMRPPLPNGKGAAKRFLLALARLGGARLQTLMSPWSKPGNKAVIDPSGLIGALEPDLFLGRQLAEWKAQSDRPVAVIAGAIDGRKHVAEVLSALEVAEPAFRLLIVGAQVDDIVSKQIATVLQASPGSIYEINRFVSDSELMSALRASDTALLLYSNLAGSSGLLSWALSLRLPIVAFGNPTVVDTVTSIPGSGVVLDELRLDAIESGIKSAAALEPQNQFRTDWEDSWRDWLKPIVSLQG